MILKVCLVMSFCLSFFTSSYLVFHKIKNRQEFWHHSFKSITNLLIAQRSYGHPSTGEFQLEIALGEGL